MRNKGVLKILAISVVLAIVASSMAVFSAANLGEGIGEKGIEESGGEGVISLMSPPFIGIAGAAEATGGNAFPEDEAGISAYVNIGQEIDLEKAEDAFKSIETANETYIIGQIALDGYDPEYVAPHAYVHKDGWIVAYYLNNEPSGKIMQWNGYDGGKITTTTLTDTIKSVCGAITFNYDTIKSDVKYYDFEYPDANRMMLISEWWDEEKIRNDPNYEKVEQFNLTIPAECELYEALWSHYSSHIGKMYWRYSRVKIADADHYHVDIVSEFEDPTTSKYRYGEFTPEQLSADGMSHTVILDYDSREDTGCAVLLIYQTS